MDGDFVGRKKNAIFQIDSNGDTREISNALLNRSDVRKVKEHCDQLLNKSDEMETLYLIYTARFSYEFLKDFTQFAYLSKEEAKKITVNDYFDSWIAKKKYHPFAGYPYSVGAIIGLAYVQIGLPSEKYFDLIPDKNYKNPDYSHWGLGNSTPIQSQKLLTIKNIVKRIRNSLAHGKFEFILDEIKEKGNKIDEIGKITFYDYNQRDVKDTFQITLYLKDVSKLCKAFREIIYDDLESRGLIDEINQSLKETHKKYRKNK